MIPTEVIQEEVKDGFKIDLDNPRMDPCCVDDCNSLPTFKCSVVYEGVIKGEVYICMGHYNFGTRFPGLLVNKSTILQTILRK